MLWKFQRRRRNFTTLCKALDKKDHETVLACIESGVSLSGDPLYKDTLLMESIRYNNQSRFHTLLAFINYLDIDETNSLGQSALFIASKVRNPTYLENLLEVGADISIIDDTGNNAFTGMGWNHIGFGRENVSHSALTLLKAGIDPLESKGKLAALIKKAAWEFADGDFVMTLRYLAEVPAFVVNARVKQWIIQLECAKNLFKIIFDNEVLEDILCQFIFNESNLRKLL